MYKKNTVQAFCCFFYDKVIFCRRYNKGEGFIFLLLFLSREKISDMKKIINNILHRFKEDSLARRTEGVDRKLEYKTLPEIKTGLVFWMAGQEEKKWMRLLEERMKGVKFDKLCFVPDDTEVLETDDMVTLRNQELGFGGKIQNERLHDLLSRKYDLLIDFTPVANAMINYVLSNSRAHCITGMKKEGAVADITLDGSASPVEFINNLTKVLSEIKSC